MKTTAHARMGTLLGSAALLLAATSTLISQSATGVVKPPVAAKQPRTITVHGDSRVDDYFWLREKSNPAVMDYLKAEDAYADSVMKPTEALQESLYKEMLGHIKESDETVPYRFGEDFYFSRTRAGQQYPIYYRRHGRPSADA